MANEPIRTCYWRAGYSDAFNRVAMKSQLDSVKAREEYSDGFNAGWRLLLASRRMCRMRPIEEIEDEIKYQKITVRHFAGEVSVVTRRKKMLEDSLNSACDLLLSLNEELARAKKEARHAEKR